MVILSEKNLHSCNNTLSFDSAYEAAFAMLAK
jgi:hypothetical protein